MPIDASIALGAKAPQIENPLNALAQAMQLQGAQQQQQLGGIQLQQARQGMADDAAAREVAMGGATPEDMPGLLRKRGLYDKAAKIEAGLLDAQGKRATIKKDESVASKNAQDVIDAHRSRSAMQAMSAQSPEEFAALLDAQIKDAGMPAELKQQMLDKFIQDPEGTKQRFALSMMKPETGLKMIEPKWEPQFDGKKKFFIDTNKNSPTFKQTMGEMEMQATIAEQESARANRAREANAAAQLAVSRGQLGVSQANLGLRQQEVNQGKWTNDLERGIQVNMATGETRPMTEGGKPVGAKPKPLTESQAKDGNYAVRMEEANKILNELDGKYNATNLAYKNKGDNFPVIGPSVGAWMNKRMSPEERSAFQAQKNFLNAVLRRESGAVISVSEFTDGAKQYFPQEGDTEADRKQKAEARRQAFIGIKSGAGPAYDAIHKEYSAPGNTGSADAGHPLVNKWGSKNAKP
jgi:hypothetical protein